jgi:DNA replication protein DnaC
MAVKFSPSINIIRDSKKSLNYLATPNAERAALTIAESFKKGFHGFTLIGSYGTGKSSFLWALQQSLLDNKKFLECRIVDTKAPVRVLNFVGAYQSLIEHFAEQLEVKNNPKGNQKILDAIYQEYEKVKSKAGLLVIVIDEFGKFLEYAAKFDPDRELYFIQQLAEFVNDERRNILLLTTLHQNLEAYTDGKLSETQRQEWKKVKGRLKEITFNEPIEQLLVLTAKSLGRKSKSNSLSQATLKLEKRHHVVLADHDLIQELGDALQPLDYFSAYVLTAALQRYGQNERSLFTFLELERLSAKQTFGLAQVYDYLYQEFYAYLTTKSNTDYTLWASIKEAIDRAESQIEKSETAVAFIKVIGMLKLFGSKAAKINDEFLTGYFALANYSGRVKTVINQLRKLQIIAFTRYNQSYKIFEGTDVNIEEELRYAAKEVADEIDVVKKLKDYFDFPYVSAKATSYQIGTPRFFAFDINDELIARKPEGEKDGYISLIFNDKIDLQKVKSFSKQANEAVLFGYFRNVKLIEETLYDIQKTQLVIERNLGDKVAQRELKNILNSQRQLLNHYVWDAFYSGDVSWVYQGKDVVIRNGRELNKQLSTICNDVYSATPIFRNELINKHAISGAIHNAKKNYFSALTKSFVEQDLGFAKAVFPPEKTIYITLLKETKLHVKTESRTWDFDEPKKKSDSPFFSIWQVSEDFLESCKSEKRPLADFFQLLSQKPFKMKQGFLEFWIPTFLFIKRDDFALFGDKGYIPELNDSIIYLLTRSTNEYFIKTFDVRGVKLNLYNRYREFLQLNKAKGISNQSFIESIRPFLVLYKQLPEYAKTTKRLSPETIAIRNAIEHSQDPEKVFFEDFPKALKTDIKKLSSSKEALENYIANLQNAIRELRTCVDDLTDRIELFYTKEVLGNKKLKFPAYKEILGSRYAALKEHQLHARQKTFLMRINSPLDDRKSWLASVVHAVAGKPLEVLHDEDEEILKDRLLFMVQELDSLSELLGQKREEGEELIKLDLTTEDGLSKSIIRIPKEKKSDVKKLSQEIKRLLGKDKRVNLASLSELVKELLKK